MNGRQDVREVLEKESTDPGLARELQLALEIRDFAVTDLGLPDNDSYTQFVETDREAVTWNVVAAPEFSLLPRQWCFLVSGCVSYRGYFAREDAQRFAGKMANEGYETSVSPAIAYSTLGWFDDPLLDTMFRYSDEQLAGFIFHELAHQQLYIKGDTAFNEAYAGFVEEAGVKLWLQSTGRTERIPGWLDREKAALQFNALLREIRKELEQLYASTLPEEQMREDKSAIFEQLRKTYRALVESEWGGKNYYASILSKDLNNASLALVSAYQGGVCAFENLYRESGENMARFHQLAADMASLENEQRKAWLDQPCAAVASGGDL